jgi:hypothetical protein
MLNYKRKYKRKVECKYKCKCKCRCECEYKLESNGTSRRRGSMLLDTTRSCSVLGVGCAVLSCSLYGRLRLRLAMTSMSHRSVSRIPGLSDLVCYSYNL